jgi:hypothetical protein
MGEAAIRFYRDRLREASERHRQWAAGHYGSVAAHRAGKFWKDRAAIFSSSAPAPATESMGHRISDETPLDLSRKVALVDLPCLAGVFIQIKAAVVHPALEGPVAFLRDRELAPLLHQVRAGMTLPQVALAWVPAIPLEDGRAIARWMVGHGILVPQTVARSGDTAPGRAVA